MHVSLQCSLRGILDVLWFSFLILLLRSAYNMAMFESSEHTFHSRKCTRQHPDHSPGKRRKVDGKKTRLSTCKSRNRIIQASIDGCTPCLMEALAKGCDINFSDEDGYTPLMVAVEAGHLEVMEKLIERHADTTLQNNWGETALYLAVSHNGEHAYFMVQRLLTCDKISASLTTTSGCIPLFRVAGRYRESTETIAILKELLQASVLLDVKGSDPDVLEGQPMTPFVMAVTVGNFRHCRLLYHAGCNVSVVHEWIHGNSFPRALRKNNRWMEEIQAWARFPKTLQHMCVLSIRSAIRCNGYDVRHYASAIGLPSFLGQLLLNDYFPTTTKTTVQSRASANTYY